VVLGGASTVKEFILTMTQRVLIWFQILCCTGISVFLICYYEYIYPATLLCDRLTRCGVSVSSCLDISTCVGDSGCCHECLSVANEDSDKKIEMRNMMTMRDIIMYIIAFSLLVMVLEVTAVILTTKRVLHKVRDDFFYKLKTTAMVLLLGGNVILTSVILLVIISMILDWEYYLSCQLELMTMMNWLAVDLVLLIHFFFGERPSTKRHVYKKGTCCSVLVSGMMFLLLMWWLLCIAYVICVGKEYIRPITISV
jgi:hypothetical protein